MSNFFTKFKANGVWKTVKDPNAVIKPTSQDVEGTVYVSNGSGGGSYHSPYSPVKFITNANYSIVRADEGKTLTPEYTLNSQNVIITLTQSVSANMPIGTEIAVMWIFGSSVRIAGNSIRLVLADEGYINNCNISQQYGMIAIKKIFADNSVGDLWCVQGMAEVVT